MRPNGKDAALLWDMLVYARTVRRLVAGKTLNEYLADEMLRLATERAIEIIGEAAYHVSDEFRHAHADIPWRAIAGQRHILAHEYGALDHVKVWKVATEHVFDLISKIEPLVPPPPADSAG
ncbi:MAG: DUF86 domain-containing protein [Phycisphaerales bacterium]|nr:MAG: DUF86 domain-containing protein [Phycisphaerales bacterium]